MSIERFSFTALEDFVAYIRRQDKRYLLLFAYNGTGKTRLSVAFKNAGKVGRLADTLYFNAFTEDLFYWDNDLESDTRRVLRMNRSSRFFDGLQELEMENRIKPLLNRYTDFNFYIDYEDWTITFIREEQIGEEARSVENIKVSRGEENMFIWCFFLAIAQLAIDGQEAYQWVKYIYIDDPVSSLDDNNTIAVAHHLAQMVKAGGEAVKVVISTHHALFFNVLCNEFGSAKKFFLLKEARGYVVKSTTDTPFVYHISLIQELQKAIDSGRLYSYHFNMLRSLLEKSANFHGFGKFSDCLHLDNDDEEFTLHTRMINILSHGGYSLFEPAEMLPENKAYFRQIFYNFRRNYKFNEQLFIEQDIQPLP